jgi:site-specific DNA-methyltransferase (adenine-specific)
MNRIICGDALTEMKAMPDKCFDLVLTDPPYGLGSKMSNGGTWATNPIYGDVPRWDVPVGPEYFAEIMRVSKHQIIWGGHLYALPITRCWLAWVKSNPLVTMGDFELAWTSFDRPSKKFVCAINPNNEPRIHATQKPVKLARWILKNYAKPGDTILDCFCGSGSFVIAAAQLGFDWLGIDSDPEYVALAEARLKRETAQMRLPTSPLHQP